MAYRGRANREGKDRHCVNTEIQDLRKQCQERGVSVNEFTPLHQKLKNRHLQMTAVGGVLIPKLIYPSVLMP